MDDLHIWTARPTDFKDEQWKDFVELLDATEHLRVSQFKVQADRRAYVLAHVLRRLALASVLAVDPSLIVFSRDDSGKPLLSAPGERDIFFSHSHIRDAVVCAVTRSGPIGIDIESLQNGNADFDLLESFVVLPDAQRRAAELGSDPTAQFFFYWTALEAFWKAAGTGLSSANPRIRCQKNRLGVFEVELEGASPVEPKARLVPVPALVGCAVTLALNYPAAHHFNGEARIKKLFHEDIQQ